MLKIGRALKFVKIPKPVVSANRAFGAAGHAVVGHGHDDHGHHKPPGPYDPPHHEHPNREEAFLFGEDPTKPKKKEGWELISQVAIFGFFAFLAYGLFKKGADPFQAWSKREALAREAVIARGEEIEFGRYYSEETTSNTSTEWTNEDLGTAPTKSDE